MRKLLLKNSLSFYIYKVIKSRLKKFKHTNEELEFAKLQAEKEKKKKESQY